MLVQSGKPVGVFRTHEWAPRVLIANSNLVPEWGDWDEFRRLEALGLTMYGQMTAGSWIYIGTQGILQGTYECFAEIARRRFGGSLAGTITLTAGLGGMGGAQPLAVTMNGGVALCIDVDPRPGPSAASRPATSTRSPTRSTTPSRRCLRRPRRAPRPLSVGVVGNAADVVPRLLELDFAADIVTDQTSAHDPLSYVPVDLTPEATAELARTDPGRARPPGRGRRWPRTARRWSASSTGAARSSTTATACAPRPGSAASTGPSTTPASCPAYIRPLFCEGKGPFRWVALSGDPADIAATDRAVLEEFPDDDGLRPLDPAWPASGWRSRACRRGSAGSATASAHRLGLRFNEMVRTGELSAPIVIGRDHLDSGSVASPYRETEAMADGSDAIADWPLLNALVNTAAARRG